MISRLASRLTGLPNNGGNLRASYLDDAGSAVVLPGTHGAISTMKKPISEHFADLGAPLRNIVNSWGAVRPSDGAVFLRVWYDRKFKDEATGRTYRQLLHISSEHKVGYLERAEHIKRVRQGAPGFMVIVHAADEIARPRKIKDYNPEVLVPIGELRDDLKGHEGEWWGECLPGISATGTVQSASSSKKGACADAPPNV